MSDELESDLVGRAYDQWGTQGYMPDLIEQEPQRKQGEKAKYITLRHDFSRVPSSRSYTGRLALFFALTALMTALVLSFVLAIVWEGQFQRYTRTNMQRLAQQAATSLAAQYDTTSKSWDKGTLAQVGDSVLPASDVGFQVMDDAGNVLYDNLHDLAEDGKTVTIPNTADSIVSAVIMDSQGNKIGSVRMWANGSDALLTKADSNFRSNSYAAITVAAIVALGIACVIGVLTSRALTRPIKIITSTARQIRNGDLSARTQLVGDDEIGKLAETFDSMATELERDIKFEHRLTSDVAHELRTPLMATLATVEAMQDGVFPADDEHFETVASEVRRLSRLVDAMLHLSRMENGENEPKFESTDLVYLARQLCQVQEALFSEKNLRLKFDDKTAAHELWAECDPDLIREALTNFISNALRYTPEGGWVVVSVAHAKNRNEALISVQDTGMGIAKEDIPRVFSRFWRSDASRERVSGGLGVGLALTKEIVDKHEGTISVESELGKGTTFTLHLPLTQRKKSERRVVGGEEYIG